MTNVDTRDRQKLNKHDSSEHVVVNQCVYPKVKRTGGTTVPINTNIHFQKIRNER